MGKRGPRPNPKSLRSIEGGKSAGRRGKKLPKPETKIPSCPTWLGKFAKQEWRRIAPELARLDLLSRIDRAALAAYCELWEEFKRCTDVIKNSKSLYFTTPNGSQQQLPEIGIRHKALEKLRQFLIEFGMTPAARVRLELKDLASPTDRSRSGGSKARFFTGSQ